MKYSINDEVEICGDHELSECHGTIVGVDTSANTYTVRIHEYEEDDDDWDSPTYEINEEDLDHSHAEVWVMPSDDDMTVLEMVRMGTRSIVINFIGRHTGEDNVVIECSVGSIIHEGEGDTRKMTIISN